MTMFTCTQARHFYNLGVYMGMSICQGGSGFPYLAESVYTYICTGKCTEIAVESEDAPDPLLKFVLEKVHPILYSFNSPVILASLCATSLLD